MAEPRDTLGILLGEWRLERILEDHLAGVSGRFEGTATVRLLGGGDRDVPAGADVAAYEERGRITFGAHSGPSHRALTFTRKPDGGVAVRFADGNPFFELDLSSGRAQALHPCRADAYELSFELRSADLLVERWKVRGPEKDYDAETVWRRRSARES